MLIDELEHLLNERFCALVLNVSLGGAQEGAHCINGDATLNKAGASSSQLLQSVVVARVHDAKQSSRLQANLSSVNVLDELSENVGLELLDDERLMLLTGRLGCVRRRENFVNNTKKLSIPISCESEIDRVEEREKRFFEAN